MVFLGALSAFAVRDAVSHLRAACRACDPFGRSDTVSAFGRRSAPMGSEAALSPPTLCLTADHEIRLDLMRRLFFTSNVAVTNLISSLFNK